MFKGGIAGMMQKAQRMQKEMEKAQEALADINVVGESGAGLVKIEMSCRHVVRSIRLDDSLMSDDKEMLEDLLGAAFNDALAKVEKTSSERMAEVTGGLGLPAGMKIPGFLVEGQFVYPKSLQDVIEALRILPGVGQKTALRMALYLLERNQLGAEKISRSLTHALETIQKCSQCRNLTDEEICSDCRDMSRNDSLLCIVENPVDVFALRQSVEFKGRYFVLFGRLSPLDGIGPSQLGLDLLESRFAKGEIKEIILATNTTVEGEATAHYISEIAKKYEIEVSRIAHGVPLGGELEYLDSGTLSHAFASRKSY